MLTRHREKGGEVVGLSPACPSCYQSPPAHELTLDHGLTTVQVPLMGGRSSVPRAREILPRLCILSESQGSHQIEE